MKKYIIFAYDICCIGGGQLHYRNAILDFEQRGWKTYVLSSYKNSNVMVKELQKFTNNYVLELSFFPDSFSRKKQEKIFEQIEQTFDYQEGDEIVIESTTLSSAIWGEFIAQRCKGTNVVYLLAEKFSKYEIKSALRFLQYKFERGELASITKSIMREMFLPYVDIPVEDCKYLVALSWNLPEDIPLPDSIKKRDGEITIAIFSRLGKPYVTVALEKIAYYSSLHTDLNFYVLLIGDGLNGDALCEDVFGKLPNARVQVTGNMYPVPIKLFDIIDIGISSSGAAGIMGRYVPTIAYDAVELIPIGILGHDTFCTLTNSDNPNAKGILEYFDLILNKECVNCVEKYSDYMENLYKNNGIAQRINAHFYFIESAKSNTGYFQEKVKVGLALKIKSIFSEKTRRKLRLLIKK